jgi:hypothetical protein
MGMIRNILNRLAGKPDETKMAQMAQDVQQRKLNYSPFTISNQNAQSWDPDTHPEGRGDSRLVSTIDYDAQSKNLDVEYRDGFKARYENIDKETAEAFNRAPSKGRFALRNLWGLDYKEIT